MEYKIILCSSPHQQVCWAWTSRSISECLLYSLVEPSKLSNFRSAQSQLVHLTNAGSSVLSLVITSTRHVLLLKFREAVSFISSQWGSGSECRWNQEHNSWMAFLIWKTVLDGLDHKHVSFLGKDPWCSYNLASSHLNIRNILYYSNSRNSVRDWQTSRLNVHCSIRVSPRPGWTGCASLRHAAVPSTDPTVNLPMFYKITYAMHRCCLPWSMKLWGWRHNSQLGSSSTTPNVWQYTM